MVRNFAEKLPQESFLVDFVIIIEQLFLCIAVLRQELFTVFRASAFPRDKTFVFT